VTAGGNGKALHRPGRNWLQAGQRALEIRWKSMYRRRTEGTPATGSVPVICSTSHSLDTAHDADSSSSHACRRTFDGLVFTRSTPPRQEGC
jgi:hypothetical protein